MTAILTEGPNDDWEWVANMLLPMEAASGWKFGEAINRMRQGERDPGRVMGYEDITARSAVLADHILMAVLAREAAAAPSKRVLGPYQSKGIQAYTEALNEGGDQPWMLSKLMFGGEGRAGKTSLLRSLLGQQFNEVEPSTLGATAGSMCSVRRMDAGGWQAQPEEERGRSEFQTVMARAAATRLGEDYRESVVLSTKMALKGMMAAGPDAKPALELFQKVFDKIKQVAARPYPHPCP